MNILFLFIFFFCGSTVLAQEMFISTCKRVNLSKTDQGLYARQVKWLKILYKTDDCKLLGKQVSKIKSLSQIIPTPWSGRSKAINENIRPMELRDNFIPNHQFNEDRNIAEKVFWNLTLFSEFKNIKNIAYSYQNESGTNLCDFISQVPTIESVTLIGSDPNEKDLECILKNKLKVFLLGSFNPSQISDKYRNQIFGINNFLGNIEELYRYKNLSFIGLDEFEGKSSLKVLMGVRNLTSLHINLRKVIDPHEIGNLNSLRHLSLNCTETFSPVPKVAEERKCKKNSLSDIKFISNLSWLKSLNLSWNEIQDLSPLEGLKHLEFLDLRMNSISTLPSFQNLSSLKYLDLAGNNIQDISNISTLKDLRLLNLANNQIRKVSNLSKLKELKFLSIGNNPNEDLTSFIPPRSLKVLNLDSVAPFKFHRSNTNAADIILGSIEQSGEKFWAERLIFENILNLYLENGGSKPNKAIQNINFDGYKNLEILSISNNELTNLPDLKKLEKLKYLDVSNNNLETSLNQKLIPKNVKYLSLEGSISGELPNLSSLIMLESLNLSRNEIEVKGNEINSARLIFLSLEDTGLTKVPLLTGVSNLKFLELQNNSIDILDPLLPLKELVKLDLGQNRFETLPNFSNYKKLKVANFESNLLKDIRNIITIENTLTNSPTINLENNRISNLSLFKQPGFEFYGVYLAGNPIEKNNENCPANIQNNLVLAFCNSLD